MGEVPAALARPSKRRERLASVVVRRGVADSSADSDEDDEHEDDHDDEEDDDDGDHRRRGRVLDVLPDIATFDSVRELTMGDTLPTGPFYIQGSIYPGESLGPDGVLVDPLTEAIGTFRSWGWIVDGVTGLAVVHQSFELEGGSLQIQGLEDEKRAIIGGTDRFRNVRGEVKVAPINPANLSFRAQFHLQGAGHHLGEIEHD
jgi:hypothetical protein